MPTIIQLLRHGTPEGGNKFRGHSIDDPLSEKGWQQMNNAIGEHNQWDMVISSPLQRCYAFAQSFADKHNIPLTIDDRLKEVGFGIWEGKSSQQILVQDPAAIKNFYHDPIKYRPKNAEELPLFQKRVSAALQDILTIHNNKRILVVAHAGVIRAAITSVTGSPESAMYRISIGNAALITIQDDGIRPATLILN